MFLDRYVSQAGTQVALALVNELVVAPAPDPRAAVEQIFAFDPTSLADRPGEHAEELGVLAGVLHDVVRALDEHRVDTAADILNRMLASAPPVPHLQSDGDRWTLHQHRPGAGLVEAWTSICANALAGIVGDNHHDRVHLCAATDCRRAFVDTTKNGSRRFCSERCQNRTKATARRLRRSSATPTAP